MILKKLTSLFILALMPLWLVAQVPKDPKFDDYFEGIELYKSGQFSRSADLLQRFQEEFPEHALNETGMWYRVKAQAAVDSAGTRKYFHQYTDRYPANHKTVELYLELAHRYAKTRRNKTAIAYYRLALQREVSYQEGAQIYYWMAESSVLVKNNKQARAYYLQLARKYPRSSLAPAALYSRGRLFLAEKNLPDATKAFELLREKYPNDKMTRRIGTALGEAYYTQKEFEKAIAALKNAMPYLDKEGKSKAVFLIAESYNYQEDFENAMTYYLQYINLNKGQPEERIAHYGLGWVYNKQQIYHWAADEFGKATEGDDEIARKALYYKAVNQKLGGRYMPALETFDAFGERFKTGLWVEEAYYEWAITAFETAQYRKTIEICLAVIRGDVQIKDKGRMFTLLGEAYFANGEFTRAIQAFEEAEKSTQVDPKVKLQARFQKGWVLFRNQAYKQAQPIFQAVYEADRKGELAGEALFWSADAFYMLEDYGPAGARFEKFLNEFPGHEYQGAARYSLGWSHFKMGDYEKAVEPLELFIDDYQPPPIALFPYDIDAHLRLGDANYAIRRYDRAIGHYRKAIGAEPGGDYALYQIGNAYYRSNRSYEAVTNLRKMLRIYPYSRLREQAQYNIAYIYFLVGNYAQAITEFQTVITKYPNTSWAARAQYNIGDAHYNASQYSDAVVAYKTVLDEYPRSDYIIEAVNGIQFAQLAAGEADSSSAVLEAFLARNPRSGTADRLRFRKAQNLLESGDYPGAVASFREYIRITNVESQIPEAYFSLADAYQQMGDQPNAIQSYTFLADNYPNAEKADAALLNLAGMYFEAADYDRSLEAYTRLLAETEKLKADAFIGIGNSYLELAQLNLAQEAFDQALDLGSQSDAGSLGLAKVSFLKGQLDQANLVFGDIASNNTTHIGAEAQFMIGEVFYQKRDYDRALQAYSNVKILYEAYDKWVSEALLKSVNCYNALGDAVEAQNTLKLIVERYPGTNAANEAARILE